MSGILSASTVAAGLGVGRFGVLSIIRLRSSELSQHEVAYYFASLALGLLGGLGTSTGWLGIAGSGPILLVMALADHPRLFARHHNQLVVLDSAVADQEELVGHLEQLPGARVHALSVQRLDLVNDSTWVDVRCSEARRLPVVTDDGTGTPITLHEGAAGAGRPELVTAR